MRYLVGVDLGQRHDPSAVAIIDTGRDALDLRLLSRLPLGQPFEHQLRAIQKLIDRTGNPEDCQVIIDAGGLGLPVLEQAQQILRPAPIGATLTSGNSANRKGMRWTIPKADLIASLQIAVETRQLRVAARLPELETFKDEMMAFRYDVTASGATTFGNDTALSRHDDTVIAVGLAVYLGTMGSAALRHLTQLVWRCRCGAVTHFSQAFCTRCERPKPTANERAAAAAAPGPPWRCSDIACWMMNPGEAVRCQHCGQYRPDYAPPEGETIDAQEFVPGVTSYRNVPEAMRRKPSFEEVSRVYGWRPPWRGS